MSFYSLYSQGVFLFSVCLGFVSTIVRYIVKPCATQNASISCILRYPVCWLKVCVLPVPLSRADCDRAVANFNRSLILSLMISDFSHGQKCIYQVRIDPLTELCSLHRIMESYRLLQDKVCVALRAE